MANAFVVIGSAFGKCHFVVDRFLGQEYPLEKGMETHSSILAWQIPWTEEPGRLHVWGCRVRHKWAINTFTFTGSCSVSFPNNIKQSPMMEKVLTRCYLNLWLSTPVLNQILEAEFWVKWKRRALLLCQTKGNILVSVLKNCPLESRAGHGSWTLAYKRWVDRKASVPGSPTRPC